MKPGFNGDIENSDYHSDREYTSSSALKLFLREPEKYYRQYVLGEAQEHKAAYDFGTYVHSLILEPHTVEDKYHLLDKGQIRRGNVYDEIVKDNEGKIILSDSQASLAQKLVDNYEKYEIKIGKHGYEENVKVSTFFTDGFAEQTLCGELDGMKIKARFDYRKEFDDFGSINDVKTTSSKIEKASDVTTICEQYDYDLSAALYVDLATQETGKIHDFYLLFLNKINGDVKLYRISDALIEQGRQKYKEAIRGLLRAKETGIYYENKIEEIQPSKV